MKNENKKLVKKEYLENENKESYLVAIENHILQEGGSFSKISQNEFDLCLVKDKETRYNVDFFGLLPPAKGKKNAIQTILEKIKDNVKFLEEEAIPNYPETSYSEYLIVFQDRESALKIREKYEQKRNKKIRSIVDLLITINLRWFYFNVGNLTELHSVEWANNLNEGEMNELRASLAESEQKDQIIEHSEALNQLKKLLS